MGYTDDMENGVNMTDEGVTSVQKPGKGIPYVTLIIILACVITGTMCLRTDGGYLRGALNYDYIVKNYEYGRILSHMFLHGGFDHMYANMISLLIVGSLLERNYGRIQMVIVYFGSGIVSGIASMLIVHSLDPYNPNHYSIGASGAVFGVIAALLIADALQNRSLRLFDIAWAVALIVINLIASSGDNIDSWAHVIGAVTGGVMGLIIGIRKWQGYRENKFFKVLAAMIVVCLCIAGVGEAHIGDSLAELNDERISYVKQEKVYNDLNITFEEVLELCCDDTSWTIFKAEDGRTIVNFDGTLKNTRSNPSILVQFTVADDCSNFHIGYMAIDGEVMTKDEIVYFLGAQLE